MKTKEYLFEVKYFSGQKTFYRFESKNMAGAMAFLSVHLVKNNLLDDICMVYAVNRTVIRDPQQAQMAKHICDDWLQLQGNPDETTGWAGTETETGNEEEE